MQDQLHQLTDLNTHLETEYTFTVNSLSKLKAVRTPPFHHRAVELVKKRESQMEAMMIEGAQLDMLKRENAVLKDKIKGLEGVIEGLKGKEGVVERMIEEQKVT